MPRLGRRLIVLSTLIVAMMCLASPQPTRADLWGECDADFINRTTYCSEQNADCINNSGVDCQESFNSCLDQSATIKTDCINATDPTPQPWPVIDQSRSWCLEGCRTGCAEITTLPEKMVCNMTCTAYCNENYPKP